MPRSKGGQVYEAFAREFLAGGCWCCGWPIEDDQLWHVKLDIAHIIGGNGRRVEDRRAIVLLCQYPCHQLAHGATVRVNGLVLPKLTLGNLLWLKRERDKEHYDPDWLASLWHGKTLPDPERPERLRESRRPAWATA
jgi:hypothetical protein